MRRAFVSSTAPSRAGGAVAARQPSQSRAVRRSQTPSGRARVGMTIGAQAAAPVGASGGVGAIRSRRSGAAQRWRSRIARRRREQIGSDLARRRGVLGVRPAATKAREAPRRERTRRLDTRQTPGQWRLPASSNGGRRGRIAQMKATRRRRRWARGRSDLSSREPLGSAGRGSSGLVSRDDRHRSACSGCN